MADSMKTGLITLSDCRHDHFAPFVGKILHFEAGTGEQVRFKLLEVNAKPQGGRARAPFSLLLSLLDRSLPPQGLLTLRQEGFAPDGWFINRISLLGGDPNIAYCEAVFT